MFDETMLRFDCELPDDVAAWEVTLPDEDEPGLVRAPAGARAAQIAKALDAKVTEDGADAVVRQLLSGLQLDDVPPAGRFDRADGRVGST